VRITHPFHALRGREFLLVDERRNRHGDRIWYQADDGSVRTVPRGWTSLAVADPLEVIAAGRTPFRADDLMRLADLLDDLCRPPDDPNKDDEL
jgi:hypothetical protein